MAKAKQTHRVALRVTRAELQALRRASAESGMTITNLIRRLVKERFMASVDAQPKP